jgi:hypothetical protein
MFYIAAEENGCEVIAVENFRDRQPFLRLACGEATRAGNTAPDPCQAPPICVTIAGRHVSNGLFAVCPRELRKSGKMYV